MSDCCTPQGYRAIFSTKSARDQAKRYRREGLDDLSRRVVDHLKQGDLAGKTILEIGGGIGAIQIELLRAGAASAVSIELTPTYEESATELLREANLQDRVERRVMDFTEAAGAIAAADIVVLNRVLCCYPDMPRLAKAAADHCRGTLVMTFPRDQPWIRAGLAIANLALWLTRRHFHIFVHPVRSIMATAKAAGLTAAHEQRGLIWQLAALQRD